MLASIFNLILDYEEEIKKEKGRRSSEFKTLEELYSRVNKEYWKEYDSRKLITKRFVPANYDELLVSEVKNVQIFKTPQGETFYELDGRRFDYPSEVIEHILVDRKGEIRRYKEKLKKDAKRQAQEELDSLIKSTRIDRKAELIRKRRKLYRDRRKNV